MSRTDLDPATLARSLRRMAGDGSIEWVMEPIQASVLLDVADMLAENARLRELVRDMWNSCIVTEDWCLQCRHRLDDDKDDWCDVVTRMQELGIEVTP